MSRPLIHRDDGWCLTWLVEQANSLWQSSGLAWMENGGLQKVNTDDQPRYTNETHMKNMGPLRFPWGWASHGLPMGIPWAYQFWDHAFEAIWVVRFSTQQWHWLWTSQVQVPGCRMQQLPMALQSILYVYTKGVPKMRVHLNHPF